MTELLKSYLILSSHIVMGWVVLIPFLLTLKSPVKAIMVIRTKKVVRVSPYIVLFLNATVWLEMFLCWVCLGSPKEKPLLTSSVFLPQCKKTKRQGHWSNLCRSTRSFCVIKIYKKSETNKGFGFNLLFFSAKKKEQFLIEMLLLMLPKR